MELHLTNETDYDGRVLRGIIQWAMGKRDQEYLRCKCYYNRSKHNRVTGWGYYNYPQIKLGLKQGKTSGIRFAQVALHEIDHVQNMRHPEMVSSNRLPVVEVMGFPEQYRRKLEDGRKTRWEQKQERQEKKDKRDGFPLRLKISQGVWVPLWQMDVQTYLDDYGHPEDVAAEGNYWNRTEFVARMLEATKQGNYHVVSLTRDAAEYFVDEGVDRAYRLHKLHPRSEAHLRSLEDRAREALG